MGKALPVLHAFNAGEASEAALARVDQETIRLTAEKQENLMPYVVGKAIMRPGTQYLGAANVTPAEGDAIIIPFVRSATETALLEISRNPTAKLAYLRAYVNDTLVSYPAVSCSVTNGDFSGGSTGWTDASTGGAVLVFSGFCEMQTPNIGSRAVLKQHFTTASSGTEHALLITISGTRTVTFRCGATDGGSELIATTALPPGCHSLAFTPASADIYIQFESTSKCFAIIDSVAIQPAGVMILPANINSSSEWDTLQLSDLRYTQSLDVIFLSLFGARQMQIQHRGPHSWSWCMYYVDDGPFEVAQSRQDITLSPGATSGATTITSNAAFFDSSMPGSLLQITHANMHATYGLSGADTVTPAFRVTGIKASGDRAWTATISGTWAGTIIIERSFNNQFSGFTPLSGAFGGGSIIANGVQNINDSDDNAIVWYRLKFKAYTSGTAQILIDYGGYGFTGICRIASVDSPTSATVEILTDFASTTPSQTWLQGDWGLANGFPTAVALFDGRLWWARDDRFWGSVSDQYNSMAAAMSAYSTTSGTSATGDSSSVQRQIATGGGSNDVVYLLPLQRLLIGTSNVEVSARSSSLDEPLTPTNITLKEASSQGGYPAPAVKVDKRGIFIQRSSHKIYELAYDTYGQDYNAQNLMRINEDIGYADDPNAYTTGLIQLAVQRQPETYIWGVRADGVCCCLLYEPQEKVQGWFRVTTGQNEFAPSNGVNDRIISVAVLPSQGEDIVYLMTQRSNPGIEGEAWNNYYVERLGAHRDTLTRVWDNTTYTQTTAPGIYQVDCYSTKTPSGTTVSGLTYLEGRTVMCLGFSTARNSYGPLLNAGGGNTFTVSGGTITLGEAATGDVTVGLPYAGYYKSSKLAYGTQQGSTALLQPKKIDSAGLLLLDTHPDALLIGSDFNGIESMDPLPRMEDLQPVKTVGNLPRVYDKRMFPIANVWDTDARICVKVNPGYSATLSGIVLSIETNTPE